MCALPAAQSRGVSPGRSEAIRKYRNRASLSAVEPVDASSFLYGGETAPSEPASPQQARVKQMGRLRQKKNYPYELVIIGGGVAGATLAREMASSKYYNVTLISEVPYFENKLAMLQNLVDASLEATIAVAASTASHQNYLAAGRQARFVAGTVKEITVDSVILETDTILYDYVVIASGRHYQCQPGVEMSMRTLSALAIPLKKSNNVLIIGGGTVGVEFAGAIRTQYPDKQIVMVESSKRLLPRFPFEARAAIKQHLVSTGVEVICSQTALLDSSGDVTLSPSGRHFPAADWFVLSCVPGAPRTTFMEKNFAQHLDPQKFLIVNDYFQVGGRPNIFAAGDCCSIREEKMAERALVHADLIAEHLKNLAKGRPLTKRYKPPANPPLVVVPLGAKRALAVSTQIWDGEVRDVSGSAATKLQHTIGNAVLKRIKSSSSVKHRRSTSISTSAPKGMLRSPSSPAAMHSSKMNFDAKILVLFVDSQVCRSVLRRLVATIDTSNIRVAILEGTPTKTTRKLCETHGLELLECTTPVGLSLAMKGVKIIYMPNAVTSDMVSNVKRVVTAAKASGAVKRMIISHEAALYANEDKSILGEWVLECEEAIVQSGIPCVSIRTSLPFSFLASYQARSVRVSRALRLPFNEALRVAWIHPADIAKVVVHKLTEFPSDSPRTTTSLRNSDTISPSKEILELTGPVAVSGNEICSQLCSVLGEQVYYVAVAPEAEKLFWQTEVGLSEEVAAAFSSLYSVVRCGSQTMVCPTFADIFGTERMLSFEDWIKENIHDFL